MMLLPCKVSPCYPLLTIASEGLALITGISSPTLIDGSLKALVKDSNAITSDGSYVPACVYVCVGSLRFDVVPSPKSHVNCGEIPEGIFWNTAFGLNDTLSGAMPEDTLSVGLAVRDGTKGTQLFPSSVYPGLHVIRLWDFSE